MTSEVRFILAVVLMLGVLVGGNLLFPPTPPEELEDPEVAEVVEEAEEEPGPAEAPPPGEQPGVPDALEVPDGLVEEAAPDPDAPEEDPEPEVEPVAEASVVVEGPLFRFTFSNLGARITSLELLEFESFARAGPVQLVGSEAAGFLGSRIVVEGDTLDLRGAPFQVSPEEGITLESGGEPQTLTFRYEHPTQPLFLQLRYTFLPDSYLVRVGGEIGGLERGLLVSDLGEGLAFNEADEGQEAASMAYVGNHLQEGIRTTDLGDVEGRTVVDGPFHWVAMKSRYFVVGVFPSMELGGAEYLGGILADVVLAEEGRAAVAVAQSFGSSGSFAFEVFAGPQDYALLSEMGRDFQEVNPVGWGFIRPVLRPFVGIIMWVLVFFHQTLDIGYGYVLILVGVLMRLILFPLNHKAMRAQLRNMAVQPLLKDIQTKYKDQPEKMQKELMKLYKEHGFNPLAGCWPMLLPWPVLIALFFVFQNTIELRGVPFAWLPDLAASDPFYVLPLLLGVSMFLLQWVSLRTMEEVAPQMKMMMWVLPVFMVVIFANLPSGLNLYYLTANVATLPQSWWIARERQKVQANRSPAPVEA